MKAQTDLNTFTKTLTEKGYDGYFLTQSGYPGKLKDSIRKYLEACRKGKEVLPKNELMVSGYLQWNGSDRPNIQCCLWIRHENGTFDVQKMDIERKNRFGHSLKKSELTNLSTVSVPSLREAIAQVSKTPKQRFPFRSKRFGL